MPFVQDEYLRPLALLFEASPRYRPEIHIPTSIRSAPCHAIIRDTAARPEYTGRPK